MGQVVPPSPPIDDGLLSRKMPMLGRTVGRIFDFSFGGRTAHGHEMALELVPGADLRCVLHHFSSLTCLKGSWGQVWPESDPNPKLKSRFQFPNISPGQDVLGACNTLTLSVFSLR